ncbi:IS66 family transposase zinc-finger binding domain-containing protein [Roseateles sp. GG27B]
MRCGRWFRHPGTQGRQGGPTGAPPERCDACQRRLTETNIAETRQVFDLPELNYEVTEHRVLQARCSCGKTHRGSSPTSVSAAVQYGPRVLAAAVQLNQHHWCRSNAQPA